jgi:PA domain
MRSPLFRLIVFAAMATLLALPAGAASKRSEPPDAVSTYTWTDNLEPKGHSARNVPLENASPVDGIFNSDLAFWGKRAFQGTYEGFRIIDIRSSSRPREIINYADCSPGTGQGNQGDVIVWDDILVRSWNSPAQATSSCDGQLVGQGFEGLHVFDISDLRDPELVASVPLVPDNPTDLPRRVTVNSGPAAGQYPATGAEFGESLTEQGLTGNIIAVNDGVVGTPGGTVTDGCEAYTVPAGSIALVDRGFCPFVVKAAVAQAAGAGGMIVANNAPGNPITMGGADPNVTISSVMVSQANGATIRAGLPANATLSRTPGFGCGSHTATGVPDRRNDRLLVYNSSSAGGACDFFEIIEVPFDDPEDARVIRTVDSMHTCHDIGVILGDARRAACAGGGGARIFSLDRSDGASLDNPVLMHHFDIPGVTIGHSASWSWDGEVLIFGHEPGGGTQARCQASSAEVDKTLFFYDHEGNQLGTFVHPRPQTATENCTWHNYNVVPTRQGRILVSGNYQSGISVLDFTDPTNVREIAFADPAPLINPDNPALIEGGGDWSTYWYDGEIYESDMTRGLTIWELEDRAVRGARKLGHLNPQTQETSFELRDGDDDDDDDDDRDDDD